METIKDFESGVVSFSLINEMSSYFDGFVCKLNYLIKNTPDDDCSPGIDVLEDVIAKADKDFNEFWEKAKAEKDEAGGNGVSTVNGTN